MRKRDQLGAAWSDDVKSSVDPADVIWQMDWTGVRADGSRLHPDKPEHEEMFEEGPALAVLLLNEVIFLNTNWWEKEWPADAKKTLSLQVNCNDVFAWGCSDSEGILFGELEGLYRLWLEHPRYGGDLWCIRKRAEMPQRPVAAAMRKAGIDLDAMLASGELKPNHYDGVSGVFARRKYDRYCAWEVERGNKPRAFDKNWWDGWREFIAENPDWNSPEWQAADDAARTAWRIESGHEIAA